MESNINIKSDHFRVIVNGTELFVHSARVSAYPMNQVWPGYQRPLEQTELSSFAYFDMDKEAEVEIIPAREFCQCEIKPYSYNIKPVIKDGVISFTMPKPGQISVELDGLHNNICLFANPEMHYIFNEYGANVRYFGAGIHDPGIINMQSGETVLIDSGAIVYGSINAHNAENIRIIGRGILDNSKFKRHEAAGCISLVRCKNALVSGIIMRDPCAWTLTVTGSEDVMIENVKLYGLWRYNADGIDIVNSRRVTVRGSFVRSFDDSIVVKGLRGWEKEGENTDVLDFIAENNVVWCDWGRSLELGAETCADRYDNIVFRNNDVIRTLHVALDLQHGDRAKITNLVFENIRVEVDAHTMKTQFQNSIDDIYIDDPAVDNPPRLLFIGIEHNMWSKDIENGSVDGVIIREIYVTGKEKLESVLYGLDEVNSIKNVTMENIFFNGRRADSIADSGLVIGKFVSGVTVK